MSGAFGSQARASSVQEGGSSVQERPSLHQVLSAVNVCFVVARFST